MAEPVPAQLSREQVGQLMRSKKHFHRALRLEGYLLPAEKQGLVSIKNMHLVRAQLVYMPKAADSTACP